MSERKHWSKLPPVPGYTRVEDERIVTEGTAGRFVTVRRMLRCDRCGHVLPSLGVGYHEQRGARPCTERYPQADP